MEIPRLLFFRLQRVDAGTPPLGPAMRTSAALRAFLNNLPKEHKPVRLAVGRSDCKRPRYDWPGTGREAAQLRSSMASSWRVGLKSPLRDFANAVARGRAWVPCRKLSPRRKASNSFDAHNTRYPPALDGPAVISPTPPRNWISRRPCSPDQEMKGTAGSRASISKSEHDIQ